MLQKLTFALDRSARTIDADGRMHVAACNISKAQVSDYYGREIPNSEALGLDANTVYPVLRCPDALQAAVPTFNNLPLMDEHIIVSAAEPEKDRIVGSTGTDAEFNGEYLRNSLVIWDQDMIDRIESGEQKEISCAYRYEPVKASGTYKGFPFSLKMVGVVGNHVALVPKGRAGPDVVVSDSELETAPMPKRLTSKKALLVRGALAAYVRPFITADAKMPDLVDALQGVNRTNFKASKAKLAARIAKDAKLDETATAGLTIVLDAMEKEDCDGEDDEMSAEDEEVEEEEKKAKDKAAKDAADKAARDAMSEDERKAKDAKDAEMKAAKDAKDAADKAAKDKAAMDAALIKVRQDTIAEFNAIAAAKADVLPLVGEITGAMDSAADVYKFALDHAGVTLDGTESPSALKTMVKMAANRAEQAPVTFANDAKSTSDIFSMFPGLRRIGQG